MRILVVEDARRLAEAMAEILRGKGYAVDIAGDGVRGADLASSGAYGVILLDIMLPGRSGLDVLRGLRSSGDDTPVILVTARDAVPDRVRGLDAGADDYLVKPFHADELLARIRAVARRPHTIEEADSVRSCGLSLNAASRAVRVDGGGSTELRARESQLLELLMRADGKVVPKQLLIDRIWGPASVAGGNRLEVLVHDLRIRLASVGAAAEVATVRGVGYALHELCEGDRS